MKERTLTNLRNELEGKIYLYLKDEDTIARFKLAAGHEGFKFGKMDPAEVDCGRIVSLEKNWQLSCVGFVGNMTFGAPNAVPGRLYRIDYQKYMDGAGDYYFHEDDRGISYNIGNTAFLKDVEIIGDKKEQAAEDLKGRQFNSVEAEKDYYEKLEELYDVIIVFDE